MLLKQVITGLVITTTTSAIGHHGALHGLLQVTPSFSGDSIVLHPGLHPEHNASDVAHLRPERTKNLYYSQEGHRPALHGAKHASVDAVFVRDTIVLDHSSHIKTITCDSGDIHVCFQTLEALDVVTESWVGRDSFNLATYHVGCGDETSGKRTFFHASDLTVYPDTMCAVMVAVPIEEEKALDSGIVTWGTYESPDDRRRSPIKGHVRAVRPPTKPKLRKAPGGKPASMSRRPVSMMRNGTRPHNGTMHGNGTNGTVPVYQDFMDLTTQPVALRTFFNDSKIDTTHMQDELDIMDFMPMDGEMEKMNTTEMGGTNMTRRHMSLMSRRHADMMHRRGILGDIWEGLKKLGKLIGDFFTGAAKLVATIGDLIINFAVISVKLLMVPFGVPFDHSMNYDIVLDKRLDGLGGGNKPPTIFGIGNGFTLAKTVKHGAEFYVQCAKCGVHANMNLNGKLAFSIRDGVTEGFVEFNNNDEFTLDAQFGISLSGKLATKTWETPVKDRSGTQLTAIPFSPLTIPGIITIGPQGSISVAFTATLEGKAELLVGGSLTIAPGKARVSVKEKDNNGIHGLNVTFTPVLKATGSFTLTGDLGLPIAIECGIDVLNGKFKKTVGLIDTPSIYVQAIASHDPSTPCNDGVQVRLGAKNRIHVAALDLWDYDIRDDIIYEAGLGCVTKDGWDSGKVQPSKTIIDAVIKKSDGDPTTENTPLKDVAKGLKQPPGKQGFRLLMDADEDSVLVSGNDGGIYAVDRSQNYDLSAPWGTLDLTKNPLTLDVFGRIIAYTWLSPLKYGDQDVLVPALAELLVVDPKKVPDEYKACSIAQLGAASNGIKPYGIPLVYEPEFKSQIEGYQEPLHKPTVCKTENGLRLYATRDTITKEGRVMFDNGRQDEYFDKYWEDILQTYVGVGLNDCRTLRLTSDIKGTTR